MSKFDYDCFVGEHVSLAVSKERYSYEQAVGIAKRELGVDEVETEDAYVFYGFGVDPGDLGGGPRSAWWLVPSDDPRGKVPVWAFESKT